MNSNIALTRSVLFALPIVVFAAMALAGMYAGLAVVAAGAFVLVVRRRSLPEALIGSPRLPWVAWAVAGLVMSGSSMLVATFAGEKLGELGWLVWALLFFGGALLIGASIVRALALLFLWRHARNFR